jgi:DNA-binding response OmpR family regulator
MAKKILVIDDDPDLVEATSMILKSRHYDVVAAYGGVEGLEKAKTEKPDLIVLDVMLLTAVVSHISTTRFSHQMGMETEADDYMDKPVDPAELVKRIEALLTRQ